MSEVKYTTPTVSTSSVPLASGTHDGYGFYFHGDRSQGCPGSNYRTSQCKLAVEIFGVDLDDFGS